MEMSGVCSELKKIIFILFIQCFLLKKHDIERFFDRLEPIVIKWCDIFCFFKKANGETKKGRETVKLPFPLPGLNFAIMNFTLERIRIRVRDDTSRLSMNKSNEKSFDFIIFLYEAQIRPHLID